jgi:hypothetical protein
MSRDEAIKHLTEYYKKYLNCPRMFWTPRDFKKQSYARFFAGLLISKWHNMPDNESPLAIIWYYYDFFDARMLFSDSLAIIDMCEIMIEICRDFAEELYSKEKINE